MFKVSEPFGESTVRFPFISAALAASESVSTALFVTCSLPIVCDATERALSMVAVSNIRISVAAAVMRGLPPGFELQLAAVVHSPPLAQIQF